jgi:hypothetical protein
MSETIDRITDEKIMALATFKDALKLAIEASGKPLKVVADELEIGVNFLGRMLNPYDSRHFPTEKVIELMEITESAVPLRWLALRAGYSLYRPALKTREELTKQLAQEREARRRDREVMMELIRSIGEAPVRVERGLTGDHMMMCLKSNTFPVSPWLKAAAANLMNTRQAA